MMDVRGHLRGLFRFSGRERRTTFWLWVLVSYLAYMLVATIGMAPIMATTFSAMQRFVAQHPEFGQPGMPPPPPGALFEVMPIGAFIGLSVVSFAFAVLLVAAALTRRLHDMGRSGWWGLMPFPFAAVMLTLFVPMFRSIATLRPGAPDPGFGATFAAIFVCDIAYLVSFVTLIVFCCQPTQEHLNRYGPPPGRGVG